MYQFIIADLIFLYHAQSFCDHFFCLVEHYRLILSIINDFFLFFLKTDRFAENINDKIRESGNFSAKMLKSAMRELLDWNAYNPESTIKRILFTHDTNQPINESISQVSESFGGSTFSYEDLRFHCLGLLETAYPNSISFDYMLT